MYSFRKLVHISASPNAGVSLPLQHEVVHLPSGANRGQPGSPEADFLPVRVGLRDLLDAPETGHPLPELFDRLHPIPATRPRPVLRHERREIRACEYLIVYIKAAIKTQATNISCLNS